MVYEAHVGHRKINTTKSPELIKKARPQMGAPFFLCSYRETGTSQRKLHPHMGNAVF